MGDLLIMNAVVVDSPNADLTKRTNILIRGGIIKAISPDVKEEGITEIIDAAGDYVSRGFIDMHTHISVPGVTQYEGYQESKGTSPSIGIAPRRSHRSCAAQD